jgi:preprotein translocase subunit SecA
MKFVPSHCLEYAEGMIPKWIGNAIRARYFIHENEQYSVKEVEGELSIMPVDYSNTGVTLKNTVWSYGLHQFVQMKHNLRLSPESLTSSCISNYAYIGKYGNRIFGLTGTLGSKAEQELLSSIYNVDYARVPTYKAKRFREYAGIVACDDDWSFELVLMTIAMIRSTGTQSSLSLFLSLSLSLFFTFIGVNECFYSLYSYFFFCFFFLFPFPFVGRNRCNRN